MSIILSVTRRVRNENANVISRPEVARWEADPIDRNRGTFVEDIMSVELSEEQWNAVKRAVLNTF